MCVCVCVCVCVSWCLTGTYQSHSLQTLLQLLLRLSVPQHAFQPADQLCGKPLRLHVHVLWNPVWALRGETSNCKAADFPDSSVRTLSTAARTLKSLLGQKENKVELAWVRFLHQAAEADIHKSLTRQDTSACDPVLPAGTEYLIDYGFHKIIDSPPQGRQQRR